MNVSPTYPITIESPKAPPIKSQGIKTKLVPFIARTIQWDGEGRWVEPFLGSGTVLFNLAPHRALVADTNVHIIDFYRDIQSGKIDETIVAEYLQEEGEQLRRRGAEHYYEIRELFNNNADPLQFLFLNRACFNGVMRFNSKGRYNVPFGKRPERFRKAYITKITNQVAWVRNLIRDRDWTFMVADYRATIQCASEGDFIYLDPPYVGRHNHYFNAWTSEDATWLAHIAHESNAGYALSMWLEDKYRRNNHIDELWSSDLLFTFDHFYHVGATEGLRNKMTEALVVRPGFAAVAQENDEWSIAKARLG